MHAHLDEVRSAFPVPEGGDPSRITGFRTGLLAILNPAALQGDGLAWTQTTSSPALPPSALLDSGAPSMKFLSVQDIHEEPSLVVEADLVSGADPGVGCAFAVTDMVLSKDDADAISQLRQSPRLRFRMCAGNQSDTPQRNRGSRRCAHCATTLASSRAASIKSCSAPSAFAPI